MNGPTTLSRYVHMRQRRHPSATGKLSELLTQVGLAGKMIAKEVGAAGLGSLLGKTGSVNVQGEEVKKLDQYSNDAFIEAFAHSGLVCTIISEEMEKPFHLGENCKDGKYILLIDPLDGSSNIEVNGVIGSIFSIYERSSESDHGSLEEVLREGREQVVGGYILYGPSTMLIYTIGEGVHGFTLHPTIGEFLLSHENIQVPKRGKTYSINEGNEYRWLDSTRQYIHYLKAEDAASGRPYSARYVGSLVADFHRTLLDGGIFLYPGSKDKPEGKLRLQYEAAPMAFVMEQAGGRASTGADRILDIKPSKLHQRTPLLIGSPDDVTMGEAFLKGQKRFES